MTSARGVARAAVAAALALLAAGAALAAVNIETVPVDNEGNLADTAYHSGNPAGQGAVAYSYNIGTYEVTAGQYTAFLNGVAKTDTYGLYNTEMWSNEYGCKIERTDTGSGYSYSVASDWADRPVNYVSWGDAARFANWLTNSQPTGAQGPLTTEDGAYHLNGATSDAQLLAVAVPSAAQRATWSSGAKPYFLLTSEDEWYKAAYYNPATGTYFTYPTSSNSIPGRDMADVSGNNANYYTGSGPFPIDSGKYTTVVGEFQNSDSPYGTFDQGGNVWEWNEAVISGSYRGLRGGSFSYGADSLQAAYRGGSDPTYECYEFGFRVSEVPEPATMALLALGGIGILMRGRRMAR